MQRYRCIRCGKTFSEAQPLDGIRTDAENAGRVVELLAEGVGIRAAARLARVDQKTVLRILESAGGHCARLLFNKNRNLKAEHVQIDETWGFVFCKQAIANQEDHGDQYTFLSIERNWKLIINWFIGKRNQENADIFLRDLRARLANRVQLSSDGYDAYCGRKYNEGGVERIFGDDVDYGTEIKKYGWEAEGQRRYSAPPCIGVTRRPIIGNPIRHQICTSHAERTNLSARIFNRRLTRLTLGYSKTFRNHNLATVLFIAHFNFCRVHSALKIKATEVVEARQRTPAMAAGLTDHVWTTEELLSITNQAHKL